MPHLHLSVADNLVMAVHQPSVKELRAAFEPGARLRCLWRGLGLFSLVLLVATCSFAGILLTPTIPLKLLLSVPLGLGISLLFVIGHDACHDSLTPSHRLNQILGRICFWPTLHPYVCWELGHNRLHHGWTNLKGVDYVYPPYSVEEFGKLPAWRRLMERTYRSTLGIGLFYLIEIWWKHMLVPRRKDFAQLRVGPFVLDLFFVLAFLGVEVWLAWHFAASGGIFTMNLICALMIPYAIWNWLMAFVTIQHHTHPKAPWFRTLEEWSFFHGQVHGTIHIRLPRWMELMFHNILDHTAHHVDPKIPLYRLTECQRELETQFAEDVVIEHSSIPALRRVLRACKLYDFDKHCWLDFEGNPSAPPIPLHRWHRAPRAPATPAAVGPVSGGD